MTQEVAILATLPHPGSVRSCHEETPRLAAGSCRSLTLTAPSHSHEPRPEAVALGPGAGGGGVGGAEVRPLRGRVRAVRLHRLAAHLADHRPVAHRRLVALVVVLVVGAH